MSKLCYDERCVSIRALNGVVCVCFVLCCVSLRRIALSYVVTALLRFVVLFCVTLCCGVLLCIVQHCFVLLCCVFLYISFKVSTSKLDVYSNNFHMWQSATQPFDNVLYLTVQISTNVLQALPSVTIMPRVSTSQALSAVFVNQVTQEMA